ncbi:pentapeptide repeat-containing protein [Nodosilinea sp. P-1105]|uniref:pentapeptide repeat-containing protein n=1 Tax=Nodosilinea sp. P-1105 TaxID=2546229 RepID=UPI00146A68FF|nr:pentapeptide repeat-containing protein [Nodosilinea sp. P-1105]NMF86281.1 pentapeptide repeat-containing protein [Nodosilinea sp. P-1105]
MLVNVGKRGVALMMMTGLMACSSHQVVRAEPLVINGCVIEPNTDCTHVGQGLKYKDLTNADLQGADFSGLTLHGSSLRGANLSQANLQGVEFDMAALVDANLSDANLTDAYFSLSDVTGVNLQGAILTNVNLQHARNAATVNLEGAQFCNTTLPDGSVRNDHC